MKHAQAESTARNPARAFAEVPALLVPGGSCSSLCRPADACETECALTSQFERTAVRLQRPHSATRSHKEAP